jgi:tetratricopeptide (TPR) repeat protein
VIFVHGLGGDYAATWRYDQNASWPHWLAEEFPAVGVWSLDYAASPTKLARLLGFFTGDRDAGYSMALPDRAGQVLDLMVQNGFGERPLLFICHSLGGLLVKQILRKANDADDDPRKKQVAAQTRAVLFLATPHAGAELASLADAFRTLFGTTVSVDDLRLHDAHLLDLYNWYRNHSLGLGIRTVTYYEKRPVMGVLPIVNPTSSQAGVGADAVPLDEDHLSIASPRARDDQVCNAARDLISNYVLAPHAATATKPVEQSARPLPVAAAGRAAPTKDVDRPERGVTDRAKMTRILFLASNPESSTSRLDLEEELSSVENQLSSVEFRDEIELKTGHAVRPDDLVRFLRRLQPTIVHFSGHGSPEGILLRSEIGHTVVSGEALAQLFRDRHVDLIVLNACYSESQASLLKEVVPAVVGTTEAVGDEASRRFSTAFYRTLGDGHPVRDALRDGKDAVAVHGLVDVFHGYGDLGRSLCGPARNLFNDDVRAQRTATPPMQQQAAPVVAAASEPQRVIVQVQSPSAGDNVRIPCELPPAAEKHFGRQTELKQLTERLGAGKNSAVVGPAGMGKTALAAQAVRAVVGETAATLAASPFPDGVVFLDLYTYQGKAEPAWNNLANALAGPGFMESSSAQYRATEACRSRRALVIIEGGEEADGQEGRTSIPELCRVFSLENRCLLLTRLSTQAAAAESVELKEALHPDDAAKLLDSLSKHRLTGAVREQVLALLEGHPLALTWAGGLLARGDDDPERLVKEWEALGSGSLSDPAQAEHTLAWLFDRSVRGLDQTERQLLQAAGLLARAPFPLAAMEAVLDSGVESARNALKSLVQRGLLRKSEGPGHWEFTHVLGYRFARKETGSDAAMRERIGVWLNSHLHAVIADTASQHEVALTSALEHAAALLRTDDGQNLWIPLANDLLYDIFDRLTRLGRLDLIGLALSGAGDWLARLPALTAQEPEWLRERSAILNRRGDLLRDQGDLDGALKAYRESLSVSRRLAQTDPSNAIWQHDLSVNQERIGDVLRDQGDLDGALAAYRESLALIRGLTQTDPSNALWQRGLSVSHNKFGDVLRDQGDLDGALTAFRESLALRRHLAQTDPSNAGWQRDLSVSLDRIGDVLRDQGDLDGALTAFRESLALSRRLTQADPSNAGWQRDVSESHSKVGDVLHDQGDLDGALTAFRESLALNRRLVQTDPSNSSWQRDLSVSQERLGDVLRGRGDLDGGLTAYRESLAMSRRLAQADPSNAVWQRDLSVSHIKVGDVLSDRGDLDEALMTYRESLTLSRRLAQADPSNAVWQRDLSFTLNRLANLHERQGNLPEALPLAEESLEIAERLAGLDRTNVQWQKSVAVSRGLVARLKK